MFSSLSSTLLAPRTSRFPTAQGSSGHHFLSLHLCSHPRSYAMTSTRINHGVSSRRACFNYARSTRWSAKCANTSNTSLVNCLQQQPLLSSPPTIGSFIEGSCEGAEVSHWYSDCVGV